MSAKKKLALILNSETTEINDSFMKVLDDWSKAVLKDLKFSYSDYVPIVFSVLNTEESIFAALENAYNNNGIKLFIGTIAVGYLYDSAVEWFQDHPDTLWVTPYKPYNSSVAPNVKCIQISEENYMKAFEILHLNGVYQNHVPIISSYQGQAAKNTNPEYVKFYTDLIQTNLPNTIFSIDALGNSLVEENFEAIIESVASNQKQDAFAFRLYNPYLKKIAVDFIPFDLVTAFHVDPTTRDVTYALAVDSLIVLLELANTPDKTVVPSSTGDISFDQSGCRTKQTVLICYKKQQNSVVPDKDYWAVVYPISYQDGVLTPLFENATTSSVNMVTSVNNGLDSRFESVVSLESKITSAEKRFASL